MRYDFLIETYATERMKVLNVWSEFHDDELEFRPRPDDNRGRSFREQMIHQCVSEDLWFRTMLKIDVGAPPLPQIEQRVEFIKRYAEDSDKRLHVLDGREEIWFESETTFFDVGRSNAWVLTRRISHTSHHHIIAANRWPCSACSARSPQQLWPYCGHRRPMQNHAPTVYAYRDLEALMEDAATGQKKSPLPTPTGKPVTERP